MADQLGTTYNEVTGQHARLCGETIVHEFDLGTQYATARLKWFRDAVADVRSSMNVPTATLWINRVVVYERLYESVAVGWGRSRDRNGAVAVQQKSLVLSKRGWANPRTVYEEVAHSLERRLPLQESDAVHHSVELQFYRNIIFTDGVGAAEILGPIRCHLDIYRGFVQSKAFHVCSDDDRREALNIIEMLAKKRPCRRFGGRSRSRKRSCAC